MAHTETTSDSALELGIGALSRATGVPVETLRTWERRYGFPSPLERSGSKHRRYALRTVERVRLAVRAMALGHKPSTALKADSESLQSLIELHRVPATEAPASTRAAEGAMPDDQLQRWLHYIRRFAGGALEAELERSWQELGAMRFLAERSGPLLTQVGDGWERGELSIAQEHYASEQVRTFLSRHWRPISDRAQGPVVVCATPPGERHVLGLHMAATALAVAGCAVVFLGEIPHDDVLQTAAAAAASAIVLSASRATVPSLVEYHATHLRRELAPGVRVAVGGAGYTRALPGIDHPGDFYGLVDWARGL